MLIAPQYADVFRQIGLDGDGVFDHPLVVPWRSLPDRENCTLATTLPDGRHLRLHVKRYASARGSANPAEAEVAGLRLLIDRAVPTVDLVGWGTLPDRRSFIILDDLRGYEAADKLVARGLPFETLLKPTAQLAAKLHSAGLHHRDLYLCHFFAKVDGNSIEMRLIDTARVREVPRIFPRRWIVKDLAQFWYSTTALPIDDAQRMRWLTAYGEGRSKSGLDALCRRIEHKAASIAKHDARLRAAQPLRNISIPQSS